jgi:histidinol-phosphate aminotransferase
MGAPLDRIKSYVRELQPYSLKVERANVKLNQNENPWDVPSAIRKESARRFADLSWSRYPAFSALELQERLARFAGWKSEGVIAGNGSNELIQALLMVTVGSGTRVIINEPTFALYRQIATVLGGEVLSVPLTNNLQYDVKALFEKVQSIDPDVVIICSPNNPTGGVFALSDLASLLELSRGLVIVDEAYFEFSGQTVLPLLEKYSRLVVLRTFSKAMALAALRVGYLLAAPELVREIAKAVLPYNLNSFSQNAAEVAIEKYEDELRPLVDRIVSERDRVYAELSCIDGFEPLTSRANFMLVRSAISPARVYDELLKRDILIRDVSRYPLLRDYFRISIGRPDENDRLLSALREVTAQQHR